MIAKKKKVIVLLIIMLVVGIGLMVITICMDNLEHTNKHIQLSSKRQSKKPLSIIYIKHGVLVLNGVSDRTISCLNIAGNGFDCIALTRCSNIIIQNCMLHNSTKDAVTLNYCKNITVQNCFVYSVSAGVYALQSSGISINNNQFLNMLGPFPSGQFVQFDNVSGPGNRVNFNRGENLPGQSDPEDAISMYQSNGTPDHPIQIKGNWIRGGGPSNTGSGIALGDNGGSFEIAEDNVLVNPGDIAIGIAGGNNIKVINNKIYGKRQVFTNVGLSVWNEYKWGCATNTVAGNQVKWISSTGEENGCWDGKNCGKISGWETNNWNATLNENILPAKIINIPFPKN